MAPNQVQGLFCNKQASENFVIRPNISIVDLGMLRGLREVFLSYQEKKRRYDCVPGYKSIASSHSVTRKVSEEKEKYAKSDNKAGFIEE